MCFIAVHTLYPPTTQRNPQAKFVVTDFDRERVIDDELYGEMRSGEYWRRDPKANRLFLVLDDISAP